MRSMGFRGAVSGKTKCKIVTSDYDVQPLDFVQRVFKVEWLNLLWVADFTYVATWAGSVYNESSLRMRVTHSKAGPLSKWGYTFPESTDSITELLGTE